MSQFPWQILLAPLFLLRPISRELRRTDRAHFTAQPTQGLEPLAESGCPFGTDDVPPLKQDGRSAQLMLY
jgi:hypothetical protein